MALSYWIKKILYFVRLLENSSAMNTGCHKPGIPQKFSNLLGADP